MECYRITKLEGRLNGTMKVIQTRTAHAKCHLRGHLETNYCRSFLTYVHTKEKICTHEIMERQNPRYKLLSPSEIFRRRSDFYLIELLAKWA